MSHANILWRRLDTPGHDACRLDPTAAGWQLSGTTVFLHEGQPANLSYLVDCDSAWRTHAGSVRGWYAGDSIEYRIEHTVDGPWTLNGRPSTGLERCVDLDLGFTPATNVFPLRRMALEVGAAADVSAAWIDMRGGSLVRLNQRYERKTSRSYWYEAPRFGYAALLEVDAAGFITEYPGLWTAET